MHDDLVAADLGDRRLDLGAVLQNVVERGVEVQRGRVGVERTFQPREREAATTGLGDEVDPAFSEVVLGPDDPDLGLLPLDLGLEQVGGVGLAAVDHLLGGPQRGVGDLEELTTIRDELLFAQGLEEVEADAVQNTKLLGLGVHPGRLGFPLVLSPTDPLSSRRGDLLLDERLLLADGGRPWRPVQRPQLTGLVADQRIGPEPGLPGPASRDADHARRLDQRGIGGDRHLLEIVQPHHGGRRAGVVPAPAGCGNGVGGVVGLVAWLARIVGFGADVAEGRGGATGPDGVTTAVGNGGVAAPAWPRSLPCGSLGDGGPWARADPEPIQPETVASPIAIKRPTEKNSATASVVPGHPCLRGLERRNLQRRRDSHASSVAIGCADCRVRPEIRSFLDGPSLAGITRTTKSRPIATIAGFAAVAPPAYCKRSRSDAALVGSDVMGTTG